MLLVHGEPRVHQRGAAPARARHPRLLQALARGGVARAIDAGDAFLQKIADRLLESTRETDTVARLGGDEFAVLATGITAPADVGPIIERIQSAIRQPVELAGTRLSPTASIGAAVYPSSGEDSDTLPAAADAAMYVAKREGPNGYHVHGAERTRQNAKRLQLEAALREAIDRGEFLLHYQPQLAPDGNFVGAEALKVGGSFVRGVARDLYRRNLVGGIIQLARRRGLDVVAEGVETPAQRDVLAEERCRIMQGHLFARALAPEQFASACAAR